MIYRRVIFLDTMAALVVLVAETVRKRYAGGRGRARGCIEGGESGKRKGGFKLRSWHYTRRTTWKRMSAFLAAVDSITPLHAQPLRFESSGRVCNGERGSLFTYLAARK